MTPLLLALVWSLSAFAVIPAEAPPNPVLTGADPHVSLIGETVWMYSTHQPDFSLLFAYSSKDLRQWDKHGPIVRLEDISWIPEDGATGHQLWAPCIAYRDGRFYLYFSVGPQNPTPSRIGVAVADNPAGPFKDSGRPLVTGGDGFEAIDPMVFTDPATGKSFLYAGGSAGSTLRVYELTSNMIGIAAEIPVDTPPHFTEAPFLSLKNGVYHLSYSSGTWWDASYCVHHATSDSPFGPWRHRGILLQSDARHKGPGHHSLLQAPDADVWFIVYHRWNHQRGLGPFHAMRQVAVERLAFDADGVMQPVAMTGGNTSLSLTPTVSPPGVVVHYAPQANGRYIGSPSIAVLPNGDYLAAHDYFGPESNEHECATALVHRSSDRGASWRQIARLQCMFWPTVFTHRGAAYLMGVEKHHGRIVIRRSMDGGETWTEPVDGASGLLTPEGEYHTAPMPVIEHNGRLWRAFECAMGGDKWGERYRAGMLSTPVDADLLRSENWTFSNFIPRDPAWLEGNFRGWLEGNAVVDQSGNILNILRADTPGFPEKAAIVTVSQDGTRAAFDPDAGFIDFPGGAKKFTIRHDARENCYWSLATIVPESLQDDRRPASVRNTLALIRSEDLRHWEIRCILLHHPDANAHGFQYVDWRFDGDDLIAVCRTAHQDGWGGAANFHDANFLTFHRIPNFRQLTPADSVPTAPVAPAPL